MSQPSVAVIREQLRTIAPLTTADPRATREVHLGGWPRLLATG